MGTRVFIGGLRNPRLRERDLEKFFEGYGRIDEVVIKQGYGFVVFEDDRDAKDAVDECDGKSISGDRITVEFARRRGDGAPRGGRFGDSRGGRFDDRRGGGRFDDRRGGGDRGGRGRFDDRRGGRGRFEDRRGGRGPMNRSEFRLIVENLSSSVSWQDLKDYMRKAGEVNYADAHRNKQNEGVIEFVNREGMEEAMDTLDGTELNGRKIKLVHDKGQSRRSRSRSRSRSKDRDSRSRSRSNSRSRSRSNSKASGKSKSRSASRSPAKN